MFASILPHTVCLGTRVSVKNVGAHCSVAGHVLLSFPTSRIALSEGTCSRIFLARSGTAQFSSEAKCAIECLSRTHHHICARRFFCIWGSSAIKKMDFYHRSTAIQERLRSLPPCTLCWTHPSPSDARTMRPAYRASPSRRPYLFYESLLSGLVSFQEATSQRR